MSVATYGISLETLNCCGCGGFFAMNQAFVTERRRDGKGFHCPYCGDGLSWRGESENERLKRELAAERAARDQAEAKARDAELAERAARAQATKAQNATKRLKVRAAAGICPCCHRQFQNMARHMTTKHPNFATESQP